MAVSVTKTVEWDTDPYPPETRWGPWPFVWDVSEYDMTGKEAILQFRASCEGDVLYELKTGEHADFAIASQTTTLNLQPATASTLTDALTFRAMMADRDKVEFRIDFRVVDQDFTDYRVQGTLRKDTSHGRRVEP